MLESALPACETRTRGAISIWMAVLLVLLIGLSGLALDTAHVARTRHQLQVVADASALAAAAQLLTGEAFARDAAVAVATGNSVYTASFILERNDANDPAGDIVIGRYDRTIDTFTPTLTAPNAVKVVSKRWASSPNGSLPLLFGVVFGNPTAEVSRHAIAMMQGGTGAGLIALNEDDRCSLDVSGTPTLDVDGGDIQVNSDHNCATCANGNPDIVTPEIDVQGGTCFTGNVTFEGSINEGAPPLPDPLELLPDPGYDSSADLGAVNHQTGELTLSPGYYSGGVRTTGGDLTLLPGIYILDGDGLQIGGNTNVLAEGVMAYVIGTGYVNIDGTGSIIWRPPDPEIDSFVGADIYEGVTIFQARDNENESTIIGTGLLDLEGTLYFPAGHLRLGGTGSGFGNQLIADTIEIFGTGNIVIEYDGRDPATGFEVFLIE